MSEQGTNNNEEHSSDDALNGQNPLFVIAVFLFIAGVGFFVGFLTKLEQKPQNHDIPAGLRQCSR